MSETAKALYTPEEYLESERKAQFKSEFIDGRIYAMTGAGFPHNRITFNIAGLLYAQFKGGPCNAFISDMRVRTSPAGTYVYPDIAALCDPPVSKTPNSTPSSTLRWSSKCSPPRRKPITGAQNFPTTVELKPSWSMFSSPRETSAWSASHARKNSGFFPSSTTLRTQSVLNPFIATCR